MIPALAKDVLRSPTSWRHGLYRVGLLGVALWLVGGALSAVWRFTIDDSGISYAYAKHLATGLGPVAAPGAPWVEGYSNALWVFLLVPFQWLSLPLAEVSKWLGVLAFGATLAAGVWLLCKEYGRRLGTAALAALWIVWLGTCADVVVWVVAGLENALLGALLIGLVLADRRRRERPDRFPWASLLGFGLCITRPEGIMYSAPVLALQGWDVLCGRLSWRAVRRSALWFVVPFVTYHLVHYAVFGEWVANTYYAKPQGESLGRAFDYLRKGLSDTGLVYLLPLALLGGIRAVRNKLPLIWYCAAGVTFILYSGGDWMPHARFVSFFAPALVLLAVHGTANLALMVGHVAGSKLPRVRELIVEASLLASLGFAAFLWYGHQEPRLAKEKKAKFCHFCQRSSDAERLQKISKSAGLGRVTVLTHDFGGPAWHSNDDYYPIDFLGLCDASVARIRRDQERIWANTLLSPYLFHEQPHAPSWIYLPKNFWRTLKDLPEYRSGYYTLSSRLLPHAPGGSYLALHRSQLVDYFAPSNADFEPVFLDETLGVASVAWFGASETTTRVEPGVEVRIVLSLVPRQSVRGNERVWVELGGAGKPTRSDKVALARNLNGVGSQLVVGEPLRVEFTLPVPKPKGSSAVTVTVGVKRGGRANTVGVGTIALGSELPAYERVAPRFPTGLPAADSELAPYERRVATAVERQHQGTAWRKLPEDVTLADELRQLGDALLATEPRQAYLAYVWATQLDARQWERLTKPLLSLRQPIDDANLSNELALLRDYYASLFVAPPAADIPQGAASDTNVKDDAARGDAGQRLVAFYRANRQPSKADYFRRRSDGTSRAEPRQPWTWTQTFEDEPLDWTGDQAMFSIERPDVTQRKRWRGLSGSAYLTSRRHGDGAKGTLTSPVFSLNGERLSFSLGGGGSKSDVGVELLVDGAVVKTTTGSPELVLLPVWWDVSEWYGKTAQLRVFDKSSRHAVLLDEVRLWK